MSGLEKGKCFENTKASLSVRFGKKEEEVINISMLATSARFDKPRLFLLSQVILSIF